MPRAKLMREDDNDEAAGGAEGAGAGAPKSAQRRAVEPTRPSALNMSSTRLDRNAARSRIRSSGMSPHRCAGYAAPSVPKEPYVAHCITGALRSFAEPRVFGSIKESFIDSFSSRSRVFVVVSFDCRVGTVDVLNSSAPVTPCYKDYSVRDLHRALAYVGADYFEAVNNNQPPPAVKCDAAPDVQRYPGYYYQQEKTRRCFEAVERFERESGECFDWVVRMRPDDFWKARVPHASSLPRSMVHTGQVWPWFVPLQYWDQTNFSAVEDHFLAAPRALADTAFRLSLDGWYDCRPAEEYEKRCPSKMIHFYTGPSALMMTSECLLGLHLRTHGVRWRTDHRFSYMMRRVPGDPNMTNPYTRTLATHANARERGEQNHERYQKRERAVERLVGGL